MSTRIGYDIRTRFGRATAESVDDLISVSAKVSRICKALDSMQYGTPPDWTKLEAELMIPAGQGVDFYYILSSLNAKLAEIVGLERIDLGARQ